MLEAVIFVINEYVATTNLYDGRNDGFKSLPLYPLSRPDYIILMDLPLDSGKGCWTALYRR